MPPIYLSLLRILHVCPLHHDNNSFDEGKPSILYVSRPISDFPNLSIDHNRYREVSHLKFSTSTTHLHWNRQHLPLNLIFPPSFHPPSSPAKAQPFGVEQNDIKPLSLHQTTTQIYNIPLPTHSRIHPSPCPKLQAFTPEREACHLYSSLRPPPKK